MADTSTSKFWKKFETNSGNPLVGATIEIIPQENTYPEGKITLIEHPTRKGFYYKNAVPMGEYKIYINGSLYEQNIFHAENILKYIRSKFNELLEIPSSTIKDGDVQLEDLSSGVRALLGGEELGRKNVFISQSGVLNLEAGYKLYDLYVTSTATITGISGLSEDTAVTIRSTAGSLPLTIVNGGTSGIFFAANENKILTERQAITFYKKSFLYEIGNTYTPESDFEAVFDSLIGNAAIARTQITGLTASRAAAIGSDGKLIAHPNVTYTDLGRIAGLSSNAQEQFNDLDDYVAALMSYFRAGSSSFSGTATSKDVSVGGVTASWRWFVQPYNVETSEKSVLTVEPQSTGFRVARPADPATSNMTFFWLGIAPNIVS